MRISELDPSRCSAKFLSRELNEDILVYVKCDANGIIKYKGKKLKYSLFNVDVYLPTEVPYKAKCARYVSDGDSLYGVIDMAGLLSIPLEDLKQVYVNTKYNYAFECAIRAGIEMGILEKVDPKEEYTYPFDEIKATLEDFVNSGRFTDEDLAFLDDRVIDALSPEQDKGTENPD